MVYHTTIVGVNDYVSIFQNLPKYQNFESRANNIDKTIEITLKTLN